MSGSRSRSSGRRRYTRSQIRRNRIVFVLGILAVVLLIVFASAAIWKAAKHDTPAGGSPKDPVGTSQDDKTQKDGSGGGASMEDGSERQIDGGGSDSENSDQKGSKMSVSTQNAARSPGENVSDQQSASASQAPVSGAAVPNGGIGAFDANGMPLLVNPTHPIPDDFTPDVADLGNGYKFDRKAAPALNQMLEDGRKAGLSLWIISAYRGTESQTRNFNNTIQEYKNLGYDEQEAYAATALYIAVPGTSEHSIGYAVDLNSLEDSFENTKEFKWLVAHCADYGFILRYPKDKVEITGIAYEPWHYRYVGVEHAKKIMSQGVCLEEYVGQTGKSE